MASKGVPWNPVGSYGCGDPEGCPMCSPMVQLEREREHLRKVANTFPRLTEADQVNAWLGEAYGTGPERVEGSAPEAPTPPAPTKAKAKADVEAGLARTRVKRTLGESDRDHAMRLLAGWPLRRSYLRPVTYGEEVVLTRDEWLAEAWLQLVNPSALCARRERRLRGPGALVEKVRRAAKRACGEMDREARR